MKHCNEVIRSAVARVQAVDEVRSSDTERGWWKFYVLTTSTNREQLANLLEGLDVRPFRLHGFRRVNDGTHRMEVQFVCDTADVVPLEAKLARVQQYEADQEACDNEFLSNMETAQKKRKKTRSVRGNTDKLSERTQNEVKGE